MFSQNSAASTILSRNMAWSRAPAAGAYQGTTTRPASTPSGQRNGLPCDDFMFILWKKNLRVGAPKITMISGSTDLISSLSNGNHSNFSFFLTVTLKPGKYLSRLVMYTSRRSNFRNVVSNPSNLTPFRPARGRASCILSSSALCPMNMIRADFLPSAGTYGPV